MSKVCIFPGTFDPFTLGHYDIAERASKVFDRVVVGISNSSGKNCMFDAPKRKEIATKSLQGLPSIEVKVFDDLLTEFCKREGASMIVRGLRTVSDLEYETALAQAYKTQDCCIEVMFFLNSQSCQHIRGAIVRELVHFGGNISAFVRPEALGLIQQSIKR